MGMKLDLSEAFWTRNPFLSLGIILDVYYPEKSKFKQPSIPLYKVALFDSYTFLGVCDFVVSITDTFSADNWKLRVLKPTKKFIELDEDGKVIREEKIDLQTDMFGKYFVDMVQGRKVPDGDIVLVGFVFGKLPVILGSIPFFHRKRDYVSGKKIKENHFIRQVFKDFDFQIYNESKGVEDLKNEEKLTFDIARNGENFEFKIEIKKQDGSDYIRISVENKKITFQVSDDFEIDYQDNNNSIRINKDGAEFQIGKDVSITTNNGKVEINSASEVKITASSDVIIDGNPTIKLGGDMATLNVNNLPNCLFTGALHSTQQKVKVPAG